MEAIVQGVGYTIKFRECFLIDSTGQFSESILLTQYVSSFIDPELDKYEINDDLFFTLEDVENYRRKLS